MAEFQGTHSDTFRVPTDLEAAKRHFSSLSTIIANSSDVESANEEGDIIHFVLKPQDHGVMKFQGKYSCRYFFSGDDTLRWETVGDGNTDQSGEAIFRAVSDGETEIAYRENLKVDMEVPSVMAPMLKPVISQVLSHEMKAYLGRMKKTLAN